jgi:hypothetical protein
MQIVADNDVVGAVIAIRRFIETSEWNAFAVGLKLSFETLAEIGLPADAPDRLVWECTASIDAVLVTGNRAGGVDSLDSAIQELGTFDSLPVITIADAQQVIVDREYRERCAISLLDFLGRIDALRGVGRLYIP